MKRRSKILSALAAVGLAVGLSLTAAAPAQAFTTFAYGGDCPGTAKYQQLTVRNNNSGEIITVKALATGTTRYVFPGVSILYFPVQYSDAATYVFTGNGTLNWQYGVYCYY